MELEMCKNNVEKSVKLFKLLADETRIKILISILKEGKTVSQIVKELEVSQSGVSHQLSILKEMHMVRSERNGKYIIYYLDDDHVKELLVQTFSHTAEER